MTDSIQRQPYRAHPADDATELYDEFQARARKRGGEVAAWIAAASRTSETLAEQMAVLTRMKGWLDAFRPLPPSVVEEIRHFYQVSLTYHSNAIEGNTLTQSETEMVLSQGVTVGGKTLVEHLEVIGHRDAMSYMEELANAETPLGERAMKDLHALILRPVDQATGNQEAGRYRALDVRDAGTKHIYPPHYQMVELMEGFALWLGSDAARELHPISFASEAHFRLVSIHPFRDGNGRTGRLLMNLCLLRAGYPITVITNARRADYIDALVHGQSHGGDAGPLTHLVAQACRESFIECLRLLATAGESRGRGAAFYRALLQKEGEKA